MKTAIRAGAGLMVLALVGVGVYVSDTERMLAAAVRIERGPADLERKETSLLGHDIVYLDGGKPGGVPVLLLHGFAADKDNWTRFSRHLADDYRLLQPDLPGHGESSRIPEHWYTIDNQVLFLEQFVDRLGLERFHLAGSSMGGHIAGVYAARNPERVLTLALFNSGGVSSPEKSERIRIMEETGTNPLLVESVEDYDRLLEFVFVEPPDIPGVVKQYLADRAASQQAFNDKMFNDLLRPDDVDLEPLLPEIRAPTLVLWGDTDRIVHVSTIETMRPLLPDARYEIMERCGHAPMVERPEESAGIYKDFLTKRGAPP